MKRLILLATGALALLATAAAPAGAGAAATSASSAVCLEASEFSSLAALTVVLHRQGLEAGRTGTAQRRRAPTTTAGSLPMSAGLHGDDPDVHPHCSRTAIPAA